MSDYFLKEIEKRIHYQEINHDYYTEYGTYQSGYAMGSLDTLEEVKKLYKSRELNWIKRVLLKAYKKIKNRR